VRDLQRRLAAAGCPPADGLSGRFDQPTLDAITAFQELRGLRTTGECD